MDAIAAILVLDSDRIQEDRLRAAYSHAHELREFKEDSLRRHFTDRAMELIEDYAQARAREIMARHQLEDCGYEA